MAMGEPVSLQSSSPFRAESFGEMPNPWAMEFEPGSDRLFVSQQDGVLLVFDTASGETRTVTGTPRVAYEGQGGLGDIAFAPDYATSGTIYLSWARDAEGDTTVAAVGRGTLDCDSAATCRINDFREIWSQSRGGANPGHYSHRLAFSPDGRYLFVASGDRQEQDPAQDLSNNLGSIVRLTPDGRAAPGNPFADRGGATAQIWSYGHRNILGLAFAPGGQLWGLEHGPKGGDELNLIERGANYGWPVRSNGVNYNNSNIPDHSPDDGFVQPAISWDPVIAPGGMIFYTGSMFADWRGQALIPNLRTTSISRVAVNAAGNSAVEESRYEFPERLRDIAQAPDGAIWVIEDDEDGRLLRLTPKN